MLAIPKYELLFIHIHKNAGKAVKAFLRNAAYHDSRCTEVHVREWRGQPIPGHVALFDLLHQFPELRDYFKFAVVRNPWDRLVSAYFWIKGKPSGSDGWNQDHLAHMPSFDQFVRALYASFRAEASGKGMENVFHRPGAKISLSRSVTVYPSQVSYLVGPDGGMLADAIVHQECLAEELEKVLSGFFTARWARVPSLTRVGASSRPDSYVSQYDEKLKRMVEEIYAPDIDSFGYRFGT